MVKLTLAGAPFPPAPEDTRFGLLAGAGVVAGAAEAWTVVTVCATAGAGVAVANEATTEVDGALRAGTAAAVIVAPGGTVVAATPVDAAAGAAAGGTVGANDGMSTGTLGP
jgi:hypothetical protein